MSEISKIEQISNIFENSVQALSNRPNSVSQYGKGGLSAESLKKWFDKLATDAIEKINEIIEKIQSSDAPKYIGVNLSDVEIHCLEDLISSFCDGSFADKVIKLCPSMSDTGLDTLQNIVNAIKEEISGVVEGLSSLNDKLSTEPQEEKIPVYLSGGRIKVGDATDDNDATPKKYVEDRLKEFGAKLAYEFDNSTYKMTLWLANEAGERITDEDDVVEIDLPLESMIIGATYKDKVLSLELKNGTVLPVDIADLISGLVNDQTFEEEVARLDGRIDRVEYKEVNNLFANALKQTKDGNVILITDSSPVEHIMSVKLSQKNLFDINDMSNPGNGYEINGNTLKVYRHNTYSSPCKYIINLSPGTEFVVSCGTITEGDGGKRSVWMRGAVGIEKDYTPINFGSKYVVDEGGEIILNFTRLGAAPTGDPDNPGGYVEYSNIQVEIGSEATEFEPYVDLTKVKLIRTGLNIWDEEWEKGLINIDGDYIVSNSAGIYSVNHIPARSNVSLYVNAPKQAGVLCYDANKKRHTSSYPSADGDYAITNKKEGYFRFSIKEYFNENADEYMYNICLSVYDKATNGIYETYKGNTFTPKADGTVEGVTSLYPYTTLLLDSDDANTVANLGSVNISVEYNRDINKAFEELKNAIIATGGNV